MGTVKYGCGRCKEKGHKRRECPYTQSEALDRRRRADAARKRKSYALNLERERAKKRKYYAVLRSDPARWVDFLRNNILRRRHNIERERERERISAARRRAADPEKARRRAREWYASNREVVKDRVRFYKQSLEADDIAVIGEAINKLKTSRRNSK